LYDADDAHHAAIKAVVENEPGPLFLPVVLLAEIDYLLSTRLGQEAASASKPRSVLPSQSTTLEVGSEPISQRTFTSPLHSLPLLWVGLRVSTRTTDGGRLGLQLLHQFLKVWVSPYRIEVGVDFHVGSIAEALGDGPAQGGDGLVRHGLCFS